MNSYFMVRAQVVDPSVHLAVYDFEDIAQVRALPGSAALKELVAEFDRAWRKKVVRTREVVQVAQRVG